jgi:hypothetical protein
MNKGANGRLDTPQTETLPTCGALGTYHQFYLPGVGSQTELPRGLVRPAICHLPTADHRQPASCAGYLSRDDVDWSLAGVPGKGSPARHLPSGAVHRAERRGGGGGTRVGHAVPLHGRHARLSLLGADHGFLLDDGRGVGSILGRLVVVVPILLGLVAAGRPCTEIFRRRRTRGRQPQAGTQAQPCCRNNRLRHDVSNLLDWRKWELEVGFKFVCHCLQKTNRQWMQVFVLLAVKRMRSTR